MKIPTVPGSDAFGPVGRILRRDVSAAVDVVRLADSIHAAALRHRFAFLHHARAVLFAGERAGAMSKPKAANRCGADPRESTQLYACKTPHLAPASRPSTPPAAPLSWAEDDQCRKPAATKSLAATGPGAYRSSIAAG